MQTAANNRKSTLFNKVVNFDKESGEITVLNDIFEYTTNFKGATGSVFQIISKSEYNEIMDEYLNNPQAVSEYWKDNVGECLTYDQIMEISSNDDEIIRLCGGIDDSHSEIHDYLREELNLSKEEAYLFNCVGGGRCFDKDYQGNFNTELSELIRIAEA